MGRSDWRRLIRWGVKSVGGLGANLALLTVWVDGLGFAAWWAVGINWALISVAGFVVTDRWVFQTGNSPDTWCGLARRYLGMQGVMTLGKIANWLLYVALLPLVDYRAAWTVGAVATFLGTFAGNRWLWVSDTPAPPTGR
jgi:putative flippase GtrA